MLKILPMISSYMDYSGGNYGVHCLKVMMTSIVLYYSYDTIVAYFDEKDGLVVRVNSWSTTTGKHLNAINPDKKTRKSSEVFEKMLSEAIDRHIV